MGPNALAHAYQRWVCCMKLGEFELAWRETDRTEARRSDPHRDSALPLHLQRVWDGSPIAGPERQAPTHLNVHGFVISSEGRGALSGAVCGGMSISMYASDAPQHLNAGPTPSAVDTLYLTMSSRMLHRSCLAAKPGNSGANARMLLLLKEILPARQQRNMLF